MAMQSGLKKIMELVVLLLVYGLCVALASALWAHPLTLAGLYVLVSIGILLKWHTRADVTSYAAGALLGPLAEAIAVHYGAWAYAKSSSLLPMWLPFLWGFAAFFLRRLTWTITTMLPGRE